MDLGQKIENMVWELATTTPGMGNMDDEAVNKVVSAFMSFLSLPADLKGLVESVNSEADYVASQRDFVGNAEHSARVMRQASTALTALSARVAEQDAEIARLNEMLRPGSSTERAPTQWAYDAACVALEKHRLRAEQAERDLAAAREALAEVAAMRDMTLLSGSRGSQYDEGHQEGAYKAFNQCASIADAALAQKDGGNG